MAFFRISSDAVWVTATYLCVCFLNAATYVPLQLVVV